MGRPPLYSKTGRMRWDSGKVGRVSVCGVKERSWKVKGMRMSDTKRMVDAAHAAWLSRHPELQPRSFAAEAKKAKAEEVATAYLAIGEAKHGLLKQMAERAGLEFQAVRTAVASMARAKKAAK